MFQISMVSHSLSLLNPLCTATTDGGNYDVEEDRDGGSTNEVDTDEAGDGRYGLFKF